MLLPQEFAEFMATACQSQTADSVAPFMKGQQHISNNESSLTNADFLLQLLLLNCWKGDWGVLGREHP